MVSNEPAENEEAIDARSTRLQLTATMGRRTPGLPISSLTMRLILRIRLSYCFSYENTGNPDNSWFDNCSERQISTYRFLFYINSCIPSRALSIKEILIAHFVTLYFDWTFAIMRHSDVISVFKLFFSTFQSIYANIKNLINRIRWNIQFPSACTVKFIEF